MQDKFENVSADLALEAELQSEDNGTAQEEQNFEKTQPVSQNNGDTAIEQTQTKTDRQQEMQLGKFKNPQELLKAYGELEREFTKRSQRLKELENDVKPYSSEEEWRQATDKFFDKTPSAKAFAKDIAAEIVLDPTLKQSRDCFDIALVRVLSKKFKTPEQLMTDGQFLKEYVLSNDGVKEAIIGDYLKSLRADMPPLTLSGGGMQCVAPSKKPRTVEEAGKMFLKDNK